VKKIISLVIRYIPRRYLQIISPLALKILAVFFWGRKVQCPICQHQYSKFLPYGRGSSARGNALCPHCLALERHRLIWLYLLEKTDFFKKENHLLHIAPEACFIPYFKKNPFIKYTTADLESPLADIMMDIQAMPFEDNTFDTLLCNHVLEHIPDDRKAMQEILRVLKPNGWAILQVPFMKTNLEQTYEDFTITAPSERLKAFGQEDHVRMYGKDYPQRLESSGFRVLEDHYAQNLDVEKIQKYALPKGEVIYVAFKK
jgi:SAM-dependent methyltransferase